MADIGEREVLDALRRVPVRAGGPDVVSAGHVGGIVVRGGNVQVALEVPRDAAAAFEPVRRLAEQTVSRLPGVLSATVVLTAEAPRAAPAAGHGHAQAGHAHGAGGQQGSGRITLPGVRSIVAVASGKGGVGKSTVAVNLAVALAAAGKRVGLLDADIFGPSLPRMMGITDKPESPDNKVLIPLRRHGVTCMSIGFLIPEDRPMIWRGPMVMGALQNLLSDVVWGELDVLLVDMPPGTGDTQLTMAQRVPLAGAVIVSTPQDIALIDARKGLNMFRKVDVPVLGIIENMSTFCCPNCGHETQIFGHGGARAEARRLGIDFLGELPLHLDIRVQSDAGEPVTVAAPDGPHARAFREIALRVMAKLEAPAVRRPPRIVMQ